MAKPTYVARGQDILRMQRLVPLVFGYYAWQDSPENRAAQEVGSGVFVAPRLGLSAKHVSLSQYRLDTTYEARARRRTLLDPQYGKDVPMRSSYAAMAFQANARYEMPPPEDEILWNVKVDWASKDTDLSVLCLEPRTSGAETIETDQRYLELQLLPPPVGATVSVCGFPEPSLKVGGPQHELHLYLSYRLARVVEHVYPIQAHGFGEFPAFRLDQTFEHGVSGAPVLWNDVLVGLFSGPDLVTALWPLSLLRFPDVDGREHLFSDLLDRKTIHARDWAEVKGHVARVRCSEALARSAVTSRCKKNHVVLQR